MNLILQSNNEEIRRLTTRINKYPEINQTRHARPPISLAFSEVSKLNGKLNKRCCMQSRQRSKRKQLLITHEARN